MITVNIFQLSLKQVSIASHVSVQNSHMSHTQIFLSAFRESSVSLSILNKDVTKLFTDVVSENFECKQMLLGHVDALKCKAQ
jgi:hypothetical protein